MTSRFGLARYLAGATLARTADAMSGPALLLLGLAVAGSTGTASLIYAGLTVAAAVGGPVLGALFDRSARPGRLLATGMAGYAVGLAVLAVIVGRVPTAVVIATAVATGLLAPALSGGWTAQLGDAVPASQLRRAQSLDAATYNAGGLSGPGLAAVVAGVVGAAWAVFGAIGLLLLAVPIAAALPTPGRGRLDTPVGKALRAGVGAIVSIPGLRRITLSSVTAFVGFGMFIVACPLLGAEHFGSTARGASLLSVLAVGALLASVATARWPLPMRPDTTFVVATAVAGAVLAGLAVAPNGAVVVVAALVFGIADGPQLAGVIAVRHREAPARLRAQVFTTGASLKISAGALGAALAGLLAAHSTALVLLVAAGTQVLALASFAAVRVRHPRPAPERDLPKVTAMTWSGYVTGEFAADLHRWLPGRTGTPLDPEVPPVEPFTARLPGAAAVALAGWDALARAGTIPDVYRFEEGGKYGFDFVAEGVPVHVGGTDAAGDVWALGHDGGGNVYVVTTSGAVRTWDHETGDLEPANRSGFTSLDAFAWALVRLAAVDAGTLTAADVRAALAAGDAGGFERFSDLADEASEFAPR